MSCQIRPTGSSLGDELTNAALVALAALALTAVLLRVAASITVFLTGPPQPEAGLGAGAGVLLHPGDPAAALGAPGLNMVAYWLVAGHPHHRQWYRRVVGVVRAPAPRTKAGARPVPDRRDRDPPPKSQKPDHQERSSPGQGTCALP